MAALTLDVDRVALAEIGRRLCAATAAKHPAGRVRLFAANSRAGIGDAMRRVIARSDGGRGRFLLLRFEWSAIGGDARFVSTWWFGGSRADRIDWLLLSVALACRLRCGSGRRTQRSHRPGARCSSNDPRQCSVFAVARTTLNRVDRPASAPFEAVAAAMTDAASNRG